MFVLYLALQAQWGWAYSLDVVLLASGCNDPSKGGTGSGIYQGRRGQLQAFQTNSLTSKMLIANISTSFDCGEYVKSNEIIYFIASLLYNVKKSSDQ